MLSQQVNDLITRIGPGTGCGNVLRRYWQPAVLSEELAGPRPVKAVRLMGEDLVAYRSSSGAPCLIGRHCPHRGADLCFGRLENGGLRCPFHGWLFDGSGACLEMPAEPADSPMRANIAHTAYPCVEKNGIIFAWMGPGEAPALDGFDCFSAPDAHTFAFKGLMECNWLQALEVGIDPAHASFLHRFLKDEDLDESYGKQFRAEVAGSGMAATKVLREYDCPDIHVQETGWGLRLLTLRQLNKKDMHVRVTNMAFPNAIFIPMSDHMTITQWHVPVDDETCYWYAIFSDFNSEVDKKKMRGQRLELYELPGYVSRRNRSNNYGYDPAEQASETYTGMGLDINVHDQWAVESPGPIQDRTREHLAASDKAIIANRRMLRSAIRTLENSNDSNTSAGLPGYADDGSRARLTGPATIDTIAPVNSWRDDWRKMDLAKRKKSAWATDPGDCDTAPPEDTV